MPIDTLHRAWEHLHTVKSAGTQSEVSTVDESFAAWMRSQYDDGELSDIAEHGASAGWSGMIYYTETSDLYERFRDDIWNAVAEDADDFGLTPLAFLDGLNGGGGSVTDHATFANLVVWYMAERTARLILPESR